MTKHTPGPWIAGSTGRNIWGDDNRVLVATVDIPSPHIKTFEEQEANARLIASAPDLFEACKHALGLLATYAKEETGTLNELKQAIAKAEATN